MTIKTRVEGIMVALSQKKEEDQKAMTMLLRAIETNGFKPCYSSVDVMLTEMQDKGLDVEIVDYYRAVALKNLPYKI